MTEPRMSMMDQKENGNTDVRQQSDITGTERRSGQAGEYR